MRGPAGHHVSHLHAAKLSHVGLGQDDQAAINHLLHNYSVPRRLGAGESE